MGGLPIGLIEELVAGRRAELDARARRCGPSSGAGARRQRRRGGVTRRRAPARVAGRVLVAVGLRLGGSDALREIRIAGAAGFPAGRVQV